MRITLGAFDLEQSRIVLDTLEGLKFPNAEIHLVHVIERLDGRSAPLGETPHLDLIKTYLKIQEEKGAKILEDSMAAARGRGFASCSSHVKFGLIGNSLIGQDPGSDPASRPGESSALGHDLLALGSSGKRPLEGVLIGSVSRKAVVGSRKSVLVAKQNLSPKRPMTVVFATDHSPYAAKCLTTFASWQPQGIGRLVLLTVFPEELVKAMTSVMDHFKADVAGWLRSELEEANQKALTPLKTLTKECISRVESGRVSDTIARVMEEEKADLLVLGAQGHGFLDRLTVGSVSLDQVVSRPYSVLVVRHD